MDRIRAPAPRDIGDPDESDTLFDFDQVRESAAFVVQSVRERWVAAVATLAVALGAVIAGAMLWPKVYEADGRLLMQRNDLMASLVNPGRAIPRDAESPTLAAREIVLGRENIVGVMRATNLLEEWERTRSPLLRFKDWLVRPFRNTPTEDHRIDALAGLIQQRLQVGTSDEGAVSFFIRWPDPADGLSSRRRGDDEFPRASTAQRNRWRITESIAILDCSIVDLEAHISETISQLPRRAAARSAPRGQVPVAGPSAQTVVQLSRMRAELEARQQDIARMANTRSQQLSEAQGRLTAALTIYTEGHPTVLTLRQTVAQLSRDSPELAAARRDARELEEQDHALQRQGGRRHRSAVAEQRDACAELDPFYVVTSATSPSR